MTPLGSIVTETMGVLQTILVNCTTCVPKNFMQLSSIYAIISTILLLHGRNCVLRLYAINQFYAIIQYAINQYRRITIKFCNFLHTEFTSHFSSTDLQICSVGLFPHSSE